MIAYLQQLNYPIPSAFYLSGNFPRLVKSSSYYGHKYNLTSYDITVM